MTFEPVEWDQATQALQTAQRILIVTHIDPDGDAIGSALGLTNAIRQMGKDVVVAVDGGIPDYLRFLPGQETFFPSLSSGSWDLMISTDASDEVRTGAIGEYGRANSQMVINLDHHVTNTGFGDIHLVVPTAVSAAEIVFDWWNRVGVDWNLDIAMPLLTGLITDTLGFRTSNVTSRTLEIAQALMGQGASLGDIIARTLDSKSWQEVQLWKQVLPSVELAGAVSLAVVRRADLDTLSMKNFDTSNLIGFLRKVNEARIAVVFKEESADSVKISLRSKPGYDVAEVAFALGGGGHKQAAGATIQGSLEAVQAKVMPLLQGAVEKGSLKID